MVFEDQSMSDKFVSPPIQMTSFGWFFTQFSIAPVKCQVGSIFCVIFGGYVHGA